MNDILKMNFRLRVSMKKNDTEKRTPGLYPGGIHGFAGVDGIRARLKIKKR